MAVPQRLSQWYFAVKCQPLRSPFRFPLSSLAFDSPASVFCHSLMRRTCFKHGRFYRNVSASCTNYATYTGAYSVRQPDNESLLHTKTSSLRPETNFIIKSQFCCLSRKFSIMSPIFLASQRDEIPGSEAFFMQELKKMKEKEYVSDDIDDETSLKNLSQGYVNSRIATKYAKRAKYLGQERRERTLTWDNIEQIRYLRQEHPEEWSVFQLARSFDVSEQTIKKVLKSKFTPDSQTRQYQDKIALGNVGKNIAMPSSANTNTDHKLLGEGSKTFSKAKRNEGSQDKFKQVHDRRETSIKNSRGRNVSEVNSKGTENLASTVGELWEQDEEIYLEEELEEAEAFSSLTAADFVKVFDEGVEAPKIVQRGREFYDSDGEFLFKI